MHGEKIITFILSQVLPIGGREYPTATTINFQNNVPDHRFVLSSESFYRSPDKSTVLAEVAPACASATLATSRDAFGSTIVLVLLLLCNDTPHLQPERGSTDTSSARDRDSGSLRIKLLIVPGKVHLRRSGSNMHNQR